jgi:hypothetical protein
MNAPTREEATGQGVGLITGRTQMTIFRKVGEYVEAEPFRPFRIRMASGSSYEIRHPETILVGRTSVRVYTTSEDDSGNGARWHDVSLMLMETLEPIEPTAPNVGQGS